MSLWTLRFRDPRFLLFSMLVSLLWYGNPAFLFLLFLALVWLAKAAVLQFASTFDSTNPLFMCMASMSYNDDMQRTRWWGWIGMG